MRRSSRRGVTKRRVATSLYHPDLRFAKTPVPKKVDFSPRTASVASDPRFREWWAAYLRMGASPGAAIALTRMNAEIDVRRILPAICCPALVLHRAGDRCLRVEEGRYVAAL